MSKAIEFLEELATRLREQDNECTSYPIYTVHEQVTINGLDTEYTDNVAWFYDGSMVGETAYDEPTHSELEAAHYRGEDPPEGYTRTGIAHYWHMIEPFMTMDAAQAYIKSNSHRHSGDLRVYVESAHRNPEMRELRRLLAGPIVECIKTLGVVTGELKQLHAHYYNECRGGCPTAEYIRRADAAFTNLETFQDPYR